MIKMVVFDMAGTTVDENNVVYKTLQKVINLAGFNFTLEQVLQTGAGKEKLAAIRDIIGLEHREQPVELAHGIYKDFIQELEIAYNTFQLKPQSGAEDLFTALKAKNILVVLNTGYNKETANFILDKLGWQVGVQIDGLITASDVVNNRPQPDMILLAMQNFGITNSSEVVKVGDSAIDIEEGKNAGCSLNIGITTGAHTYEQLQAAKPNHIIIHLSDLLHLV